MIQINQNQKIKFLILGDLLKRLITEIEGKILDISNLESKTLLNKVEKRIPNIINLVKKRQ